SLVRSQYRPRIYEIKGTLVSIQIRSLTPQDRPSWEELYNAYLEFYESQPIPTSTEILWKRLIASDPEIQSIVAEVNGKLIGIAHFHFQRSSWTHTWNCYLEDLFVHQDYRGNGAATLMINAVKSIALNKGCSEMFWITRGSNSTAQNLYDKLATQTDFVRYEIMLEELP
ncbi:MAG: GNAT family N-acetyltransferase, partial [Actinomycetes bacterium]